MTSMTAPASTTVPTRFLNITVVLTPPDVMKDDKGNFVGFVPDLVEALSKRLGFTYGLYTPPEMNYGYRLQNGTWKGMIGQVTDGNADLAAQILFTSIRAKDVDFSIPIRYSDPVIVMKRPIELTLSPEESLMRLLQPLEFSVWLMTILAFLVTSTVLYVISHSNPYEWRRMAKDKEATVREAESFTCLNSFWFIISTLAWQGYVRAPRSMGGRIVVTAWWFFVLLFILSYTASLTNLLRIGPYDRETKGYEDAITSFEDLANNDHVMVGMISGASTHVSFKYSKNPSLNKIARKMTALETEQNFYLGMKTAEDGLHYIMSRKVPDFALVLETYLARQIIKENCELYMIKDKNIQMTKFLGFAGKKNSKLINDINNGILQLYEDGTLDMLDRKWYMSNDECPKFVVEAKKEKPPVIPFHPMDLGTFSGALLILVCGLVLGGFVTLIEICIYNLAETHPDEDEDLPYDHNGVSTTENLIPGETKKGGATPV